MLTDECPGRATLLPLLVASVLVLGGLRVAFAIPLTSPLNPPPSTTVQGVVLTIRGDEVRIRPLLPASGAEVRLRVDERTIRLDQERLQVGDVIIADVTPDGHALMIGTVMPVDEEPRSRR